MKNNNILLLHSLVGLLIGYFLLHPISMVIHWMEMNNSLDGLYGLGSIFIKSITHTFSLHMMPMSIAFSMLGLIGGIGSGLYIKSIKKKEHLLHGKRQLLKQSIPSLINNGESEQVEFKSSLRFNYATKLTDKNLEHVILKSVAGFLNSNGGTLLIGVSDDGEILGLDKDYQSLKKTNCDGFQQRIILLVSNEFGKPICTKIHIVIHAILDKEICTLFIEPVRFPVYVKEGNRTVFYLRTGNVTNQLTTEETVKYLQNRKRY